MKKVIRLTEGDLTRIIKQVINEMEQTKIVDNQLCFKTKLANISGTWTSRGTQVDLEFDWSGYKQTVSYNFNRTDFDNFRQNKTHGTFTVKDGVACLSK